MFALKARHLLSLASAMLPILSIFGLSRAMPVKGLTSLCLHHAVRLRLVNQLEFQFYT